MVYILKCYSEQVLETEFGGWNVLVITDGCRINVFLNRFNLFKQVLDGIDLNLSWSSPDLVLLSEDSGFWPVFFEP